MNIIKRELRSNLKALIIWSISMISLIYVGMIKYSAYQHTGESANKILKQFPSAVKSIFGINSLDITKMNGYYAVFYLYFMLLASIHAVMLGSIIISKEERDKTADFLFAKPVSRFKVVTSKFIAILVNLIIFNIVTLVSSIVFVNKYNQDKNITDKIIILMSSLFILQLIFATLGTFIASISKNIKKSTSISTVILLATYFLSIAIDMYDKIDFLKYLSPFKYFPAKLVMQNKTFEPVYFLISFLSIFVFITGTYYFTQKRDLHV
jgi:ABC-2 type transport system permease protein